MWVASLVEALKIIRVGSLQYPNEGESSGNSIIGG